MDGLPGYTAYSVNAYNNYSGRAWCDDERQIVARQPPISACMGNILYYAYYNGVACAGCENVVSGV